MDEQFQHEKEILTNYLDENHLRHTRERYAILEAVYEHDGHFTADEMHVYVQKKLRVSRATVYSALDLLVNIGLASRTLVANSIQYEKHYATTHFHMVCTQCGATKEFSDAKIDNAVNNARYLRFKKHDYTLTVFGICYKCQAKMNREKKKLEKLRTEKK